MPGFLEHLLTFFSSALASITTASSSPLAFLAFTLVIAMFSVLSNEVLRSWRYKNRFERLPEEDRLAALRAEFGFLAPDSPLTFDQWWKARKAQYLSRVMAALVITGAAVGVLAAFSPPNTVRVVEVALADSVRRPEIMAVLRSHGLFYYDDPDLPAALAKLLPRSAMPEQGDSLITVAQALNERVSRHPVLSGLRSRAYSLEPPFQLLGVPAHLGLPAVKDDQPGPCEVHVRPDGPFANRRIDIWNPQTNQRITVFGHPGLVTPGSSDIHLNSAQMQYLHLTILGSRTIEAFVIPRSIDGSLRDPSSDAPCKSILTS